MPIPPTIAKIGPTWARRYFVTGERFDAATALRIGLVHEVANDLDAAIEEASAVNEGGEVKYEFAFKTAGDQPTLEATLGDAVPANIMPPAETSTGVFSGDALAATADADELLAAPAAVLVLRFDHLLHVVDLELRLDLVRAGRLPVDQIRAAARIRPREQHQAENDQGDHHQ